jgi:hypothetical protein
MKIDWDKVWKEFDTWYGNHVLGIAWGYQKGKIQSLVEAQLRVKRKKVSSGRAKVGVKPVRKNHE